MKSLKRFGSLVLAILIVFGVFALLPQQAEAAKKKTVYVLTGVDSDNNGSYDKKFEYNSKGLLLSIKYDYLEPYTYSYNSKNQITKCSEGSKYTYKGGRPVKSYRGEDKAIKNKFTYNNKGQLTKKTMQNITGTHEIKYKYDKKGRLSTIKFNASYHSDNTVIKYDARGNIIKVTNSISRSNYTNKYNSKGLLKSRIVKTKYNTGNRKSIEKFKYKKITVTPALAKKVEKQQQLLKCSLSAIGNLELVDLLVCNTAAA